MLKQSRQVNNNTDKKVQPFSIQEAWLMAAKYAKEGVFGDNAFQ